MISMYRKSTAIQQCNSYKHRQPVNRFVCQFIVIFNSVLIWQPALVFCASYLYYPKSLVLFVWTMTLRTSWFYTLSRESIIITLLHQLSSYKVISETHLIFDFFFRLLLQHNYYYTHMQFIHRHRIVYWGYDYLQC